MTDSDNTPTSPLGARLSLILAAFLAGVFAFVVVVLFVTGRTPGGSSTSAIGGPFALVDQTGKAITEKDFIGKPFLVFFGFTHCPDVCPTTLFEMSEMMRALGKDADKAQGLFVSVDPERDTPPVMKDYLSNFDPHLRGATGDQASVDAMIKTYRVYAKKVPTGNGEYTMDHTALVYLMDKRGNFVAPFNLKRPPEQAAADLRKYF
jgi:protein SCO1/2